MVSNIKQRIWLLKESFESLKKKKKRETIPISYKWIN